LADHASDAPLLRVRNLRKTYQEGEAERSVLEGVGFDVQGGELVVLTGRSGSGKSTLMNLISGIDQPATGAVQVDGHELTELSETARTRFRRENIGIVFEAFNLIPTLTAAENVRLPLELVGRSDGGAPPGRAEEVLAAVGLLAAVRAGRTRRKLSGSPLRRGAAARGVARALAHEPLLVLADEPTGNLDTTPVVRS
jgi:putative ABC transport system ATP-binding protein